MDPLGITTSGQGYAGPQPAPASPPQAAPSAATPRGEKRTERQGIRLPEDRITLSGQQPDATAQKRPTTQQDPTVKQPRPGERTTSDGKSLEDPQVKQVIQRLKATEEKVKAHEAAHKAAGGNLAGSASYSYTQGPDGRSYITGGEVQIDMSPGRTPQETITRMQQVIRAALAPADPSGQDRAVAAQAASQMARAQQEKLQTESPTSPSQPDQTDRQPGQPVQPADQTAENQGAEHPLPPNGRQTGGSDTGSQARQAYTDPAVRQQPPSTTVSIWREPDQRATQRQPSPAEQPTLSAYA